MILYGLLNLERLDKRRQITPNTGNMPSLLCGFFNWGSRTLLGFYRIRLGFLEISSERVSKAVQIVKFEPKYGPETYTDQPLSKTTTHQDLFFKHVS